MQPLIQCQAVKANTSPDEYMGNELDFSIEQGQVVALLGTDIDNTNNWLKTLAGVYYPSSGQITFLGKCSHQFKKTDWLNLRKEIAYITKDINLLSMLSGLANVMLAANYHKIGNRETIKSNALNLISQMELDELAMLLPVNMTRDQQLLFAIARALILEPKMLFLEAPFVQFDDLESFKELIFNKIMHKKMTLVVSTQDAQFIQSYADKVIFVDKECIISFNNRNEFFMSDNPQIKKIIKKVHIL
jgi:ABC-type polar amino acid transport system ATPase subunit